MSGNMATIIIQVTVAAVMCVTLAHSAPSHVVAMTTGDVTAAKPVNMTVYYESLCPGCNFYIHNTLSPLWPKIKDLNLMTVTLLPFGNADEKKIGFQWEFHCQHGANECLGNIVEACVLHYYPDTSKQLEIIDCFNNNFFKDLGQDWKKSLKSCNSTGVDVPKISTCASGHEGNNLEHDIASRTGPHSYTPYVMLNGTPNDRAIENLLEEVCRVYTGPKPDICKQAHI
ncbi:hypothetical protein RRG08_045086 [Elysia crispata]|uniref:Gamma-interferon-inducible lysosomal thiol reductase n=1 Tax=Elysia crispata TaxID=231223 RepID=A0AAE1D407_9GAST|nr:hypothetical protein RRG08_045086 [Elysia crispata]